MWAFKRFDKDEGFMRFMRFMRMQWGYDEVNLIINYPQ